MERKFDTADIFRNLYADELPNIQLRARFTLKINMATPKVAYIYTEKDEVTSLNADIFTISRGMVNTMGEIKGIENWVNFTETDEGVLCEIRSNKHNINPIAVKYGGGGHQKASGATLKNREEAMNLLADLTALTEEN
jgi:phosphoesterase RecJ-like protein